MEKVKKVYISVDWGQLYTDMDPFFLNAQSDIVPLKVSLCLMEHGKATGSLKCSFSIHRANDSLCTSAEVFPSVPSFQH